MDGLVHLGEWLKTFWAYLAALIGICGALWKYAVSPILKRRKAREDKIDEMLKKQTESLEDLKKSVKELSTDVGFLQHDRLTQGHDHFMRLGYCPEHDKQNLISLYDRYISQGRNSLFQSYKADILALPPDDGEWGKR